MKVSILAFYLRIFVDTKIRYVVFTVMGLLAAFTISFFFSMVFQCTPISYAWNSWQKEVPGHCIQVNAGIWAHAALNIFFDLLVLLIPMPTLLGLQFSYSLRSKLQIFLMFSVGCLVTIVSVLRLQTLVTVANTMNPTWDYYHAGLWSAIEVYTGIICACMPTARVFLMRIFPQWIGLTPRGSSAEHKQRAAIRNQVPARHPLSWAVKSATQTTSEMDDNNADFVKLDDVGSMDSSRQLQPTPIQPAAKHSFVPKRFSGSPRIPWVRLMLKRYQLRLSTTSPDSLAGLDMISTKIGRTDKARMLRLWATSIIHHQV